MPLSLSSSHAINQMKSKGLLDVDIDGIYFGSRTNCLYRHIYINWSDPNNKNEGPPQRKSSWVKKNARQFTRGKNITIVKTLTKEI